MIKDNFDEYLFSNLGIPKLNQLTYNFPEFEPSEFSEYLLKNPKNIEIFNFILNSIYPLLNNSANENSKKSIVRIENLLNQIYDDVLLEIWKININYIHHWFTENSIVSYFKLIDEQKLISLMLYIIYNYRELSEDLPEKNQLKKMSSYLLIFISKENFNLLREHEYFTDLLGEINNIFTKKEIEQAVRINPFLFDYIKSGKTDPHSLYLATIHLSDRSDILSVINMVETDYKKFIKRMEMGLLFNKKNFEKTGDGIFIKLEYLIELVKLFPPEKQYDFFREFKYNEKTRDIIRKNQIELVELSIKDNFQKLENLRKRAI